MPFPYGIHRLFTKHLQGQTSLLVFVLSLPLFDSAGAANYYNITGSLSASSNNMVYNTRLHVSHLKLINQQAKFSACPTRYFVTSFSRKESMADMRKPCPIIVTRNYLPPTSLTSWLKDSTCLNCCWWERQLVLRKDTFCLTDVWL